MAEPRTEIDARFSDPGARATAWDTARQVLESADLFWICTHKGGSRD